MTLLPYRYVTKAAGRIGISILTPAFVLAVAGCSPLVEVEGQVLMDGKPVPGASLTFLAANPKVEAKSGFRGADAIADDEGRFQLRAVNDLGALPGVYKVTVSKYDLPPGTPRPDPNDPQASQKWIPLLPQMRETIPAIYTDPMRTPLAVTIPEEGTKDLTITLSNQ